MIIESNIYFSSYLFEKSRPCLNRKTAVIIHKIYNIVVEYIKIVAKIISAKTIYIVIPF